jgi:hypothetical protein
MSLPYLKTKFSSQRYFDLYLRNICLYKPKDIKNKTSCSPYARVNKKYMKVLFAFSNLNIFFFIWYLIYIYIKYEMFFLKEYHKWAAFKWFI